MSKENIGEFLEKKNKQWPWWKYMFDMDPSKMNTKTDYKKEMFSSLARIKLILMFSFILVSIIYQIYFIYIRNENNSKTYANGTEETKIAFVLELVITFLLSFIAVIFLYWSRLGWNKMTLDKWQILYSSIIVTIVITTFAAAQELSGYNRWSSNNEGEYQIIDDTLDKSKSGPKQDAERHPFLTTLSYFSMFIFASVFIIYSIKILIILSYAFRKNKNAIHEIPRIFGQKLTDKSNKNLLFFLELLIVSSLFCAPFFIVPFIRQDEFNTSKIIVISSLVCITILLQFGFQYTNFNPI